MISQGHGPGWAEPMGWRSAVGIGCLLVAGASLGLLWTAAAGGEAYHALEAAYYDTPELDYISHVEPGSFRRRMILLGAQGVLMAAVTWLLFGTRRGGEGGAQGAEPLSGLGLFVLCGTAVASFVLGCFLRWPSWEPACRLYTKEGPIDASHAVAFGVAGVILGLSARAYRAGGRTRPVAPVLVLLAVAALVAACEEISWGQTYLGWDTPEAVAAWNEQHETNLHNAFNWMIGKAYVAIGLGGFLATALAVVLRRKLRGHPLAAVLPAEALYWGALWLLVANQPGIYTDTEALESVLAILAVAYAVPVWRQRPVSRRSSAASP